VSRHYEPNLHYLTKSCYPSGQGRAVMPTWDYLLCPARQILFACLWMETPSRSINMQKRTWPILVSSHLDLTHTWSVTHLSIVYFELLLFPTVFRFSRKNKIARFQNTYIHVHGTVRIFFMLYACTCTSMTFVRLFILLSIFVLFRYSYLNHCGWKLQTYIFKWPSHCFKWPRRRGKSIWSAMNCFQHKGTGQNNYTRAGPTFEVGGGGFSKTPPIFEQYQQHFIGF